MFIRKEISHKNHRRGILLTYMLAFTLIVTVLWEAICPLTVQAAKSPFLSGTVVCPSAGTATSLPVALTGTSAQSAVLMEASTGEVIFDQNADAQLPMASTTKIMTALVALESCAISDIVTVASDAVGVEGSSIYLTEGERLSMEDLLYALMLESANDAAVAIAIHVAGDVASFVEKMNRKATDLGLENTRFANPHGLDDEAHYTTAKELAIIARVAMEHPDFRTITGTTRRTIPLHGNEGVRLLLNHNKLLKQYDGVIGGKTGFTKISGRCLVSVAERDGVQLIAVTLKAPDDWRDHTAMLDYGFSLFASVSLCTKGFYDAPLSLQSGTQTYVMVSNTDGLSLPLRRDHGEIVCIVELPHLTFAPVATGQQLGQLRFVERHPHGHSRTLATVPLYARYDVSPATYHLTLWEWIKGWFL